MSAANFTYHIDDATCYYLHSHSNSSYHTLNDSQITRCRSGTEPPPVEDTHSFVALHCLWNETKMQSHDILSTAWTFEENDYPSRNSSLIVTCVVASKKQYLLKWNHSTQYLLLSNNTHPTHSIQMKSIKCAPPTSSASRLDS